MSAHVLNKEIHKVLSDESMPTALEVLKEDIGVEEYFHRHSLPLLQFAVVAGTDSWV